MKAARSVSPQFDINDYLVFNESEQLSTVSTYHVKGGDEMEIDEEDFTGQEELVDSMELPELEMVISNDECLYSNDDSLAEIIHDELFQSYQDLSCHVTVHREALDQFGCGRAMVAGEHKSHEYAIHSVGHTDFVCKVLNPVTGKICANKIDCSIHSSYEKSLVHRSSSLDKLVRNYNYLTGLNKDIATYSKNLSVKLNFFNQIGTKLNKIRLQSEQERVDEFHTKLELRNLATVLASHH